jgi:hypothetical protein
MDLAFVLLVAKKGSELARHHLELAATRRPGGLHFAADGHEQWSDRSGRIVLACWRNTADTRTVGAWSADGHRATVTTGPVRISRQPWAAGGRWAEECRRHLDEGGAPEDLRGVFSLASLKSNGEGLVASDALGLSFTYVGEDTTATVISSRAALVATAINPDGSRPSLDPLGVCGLAYSSYRIGNRTGFTGVRTLDPGTVIDISGNGAVEVVGAAPPWLAEHCDSGSALDLVMDEICEMVASTLTLPEVRPTADLTGGKDSRLVLAAAMHSGVAGQFVFRTDGMPELPDVQVARSLAERLGLDYESGLRLPQRQRDYDERLRTFVSITGGLTNAWDLKSPTGAYGAVRLSGANGECLRSHKMLDPPPHGSDELLRRFDDIFRFGQLSLLRPDVASQYREEALSLLVAGASHETHPLDMLESFQIRTRARSRYGPLEELDRSHRVLGLYSIAAIRAAFSLPPMERHIERVHHELMRRVSPTLVAHPFAGRGWQPRLEAPSEPRTSPAWEESKPAPAAVPLMAQLRTSSLDKHRPMFEAVVADAGNEAWDLIDRRRLISALAQGSKLTRPARAEVFGAITAAVWLSKASV